MTTHGIYGLEISPTLVSEITEDLDEEVKTWQTRRLEAIWSIVFMDGIVVHIRGESGRVTEHTMYVAIGVNFVGKKELLGLWLNETEGFSFRTNNLLWPRGNQSLMTIGLSRGHEKVLAVVPDGSEESWRDRHLHHLRGWSHGISGGHSNSVPTGSRAIVHRASGASRSEVCHGRRQPRSHS
jgi:transposase-like protein